MWKTVWKRTTEVRYHNASDCASVTLLVLSPFLM